MGALKQKIQGPRDMRVFLMVLGGVLIVVGWRLWAKGYPRAPWIVLILGVLMFNLGLFRPTLIAPVFPYWMKFAQRLGQFMSLVLLTLIFFLVFLPYRLLGNLIGRDSLALRWRKDPAPSFWSEAPPARRGVDQYERQF